MCDFRAEILKLNLIYSDGAKELGRREKLFFNEIVAWFAARLQMHYREFCSDACIEAKARDFAILYCGYWAACGSEAPPESAPVVASRGQR